MYETTTERQRAAGLVGNSKNAPASPTPAGNNRALMVSRLLDVLNSHPDTQFGELLSLLMKSAACLQGFNVDNRSYWHYVTDEQFSEALRELLEKKAPQVLREWLICSFCRKAFQLEPGELEAATHAFKHPHCNGSLENMAHSREVEK